MSGPEHSPSSRYGCASSPSGNAELSALGLDGTELQILDLMRLDFAARAGQVPRHGASPDHVAQEAFGLPIATRILTATRRVIDEMAQARAPVFRYSNPYCAGCARRITPEETHLMLMLHHQRRGHRGRAMIHALMICEARPIDRLVEMTAELAILTANLVARAEEPAEARAA